MKGGGGEVVQKWLKWASPPCVDRSLTCCQPVDNGSGGVLKEERERGKGKENLGILGLK